MLVAAARCSRTGSGPPIAPFWCVACTAPGSSMRRAGSGSRQRRQQVRSEPSGGPGLSGRRARPPACPSVRPSVPWAGAEGRLLHAGRPAREASERPARQGCGLPETSRVRSPSALDSALTSVDESQALRRLVPRHRAPCCCACLSLFAVVSAVAELILFLGPGAALCFAFPLRIMLVTHRCFSCCLVALTPIKDFPVSRALAVRRGTRSREGAEAGDRT